MGIKGLSPLLKRFAPSSIQDTTLSNLPRDKGGIYALDVSGFLYASQYNAERKGAHSHLRVFLHILARLKTHGLVCIPVFDGTTKSAAKQMTLTDRQAKITAQKERILSCLALDPCTAQTYSAVELKSFALDRLPALPDERVLDLKQELRNFIAIPATHYTDLKQLFETNGIVYRQAKGEADFVCAELYRNGSVDGVFSEDMDMLTHGVGCLIRGLIGRHLTRIDIAPLLTDLKFTLRQFQEWCILCGCDYCPTIPTIGGVKSLKLLQKWGSLADILAHEKGLQLPADFHTHYLRAVAIFTTAQETVQ